MFEKCGLRDILYRLYRYKWGIFLVTLVFLLGGIGLYIFGGQADDGTPVQNNEGTAVWVASASYLVKLDDTHTVGNAAENATQEEMYMAQTCLGILTSDYSVKQVYETLLETYTPQELIDGLNLDVTPQTLSYFSLSAVMKSRVLSATSIVNFYVEIADKDLAQAYLQACRTIFETTPGIVGNCSVQYIGGVLDQKNSASETNKASDTTRIVIIPIMGMVGLMLGLLFVLVLAVFSPTLNRKSDFAMYNLPVLGEVSGKVAK